MASIAELSPEPFVLKAQLDADHGPEIEPILVQDRGGWRANRYIGEIRHQGRTLVIKPRLGLETIMSWMSTVMNVQVLPQTATPSTNPTSVVTQLLAALWRASVLTAGQHALPRAKTNVGYTGHSVRGRLDVAATARRRATGRRELVSTRSLRSYDNVPARAVVLADRYLDQFLAGNRWRGPRLDAQLTALRAATGPRPPCPSLQEIRSARYSPITLKWKRAAEISWWILNKNPLGVTADDETTHGVLIDVAELWEMFVVHCAGHATHDPVTHGTTSHVARHLAHSIADPSSTMGKLYPDVTVEHGDQITVVDAKYKRVGGMRGVDREDLYQLQAYSSAFKAPMAALVYPALSDELPKVEQRSPWQGPAGTLSFLTLPTERDACVKKLEAWFETGVC